MFQTPPQTYIAENRLQKYTLIEGKKQIVEYLKSRPAQKCGNQPYQGFLDLDLKHFINYNIPVSYGSINDATCKIVHSPNTNQATTQHTKNTDPL